MLAKRIRASLAYIGRSQKWLAGQLGLHPNTIRVRMAHEETWQLGELRAMKKIFRWETLEG